MEHKLNVVQPSESSPPTPLLPPLTPSSTVRSGVELVGVVHGSAVDSSTANRSFFEILEQNSIYRCSVLNGFSIKNPMIILMAPALLTIFCFRAAQQTQSSAFPIVLECILAATPVFSLLALYQSQESRRNFESIRYVTSGAKALLNALFTLQLATALEAATEAIHHADPKSDAPAYFLPLAILASALMFVLQLPDMLHKIKHCSAHFFQGLLAYNISAALTPALSFLLKSIFREKEYFDHDWRNVIAFGIAATSSLVAATTFFCAKGYAFMKRNDKAYDLLWTVLVSTAVLAELSTALFPSQLPGLGFLGSLNVYQGLGLLSAYQFLIVPFLVMAVVKLVKSCGYYPSVQPIDYGFAGSQNSDGRDKTSAAAVTAAGTFARRGSDSSVAPQLGLPLLTEVPPVAAPALSS